MMYFLNILFWGFTYCIEQWWPHSQIGSLLWGGGRGPPPGPGSARHPPFRLAHRAACAPPRKYQRAYFHTEQGGDFLLERLPWDENDASGLVEDKG